MEIEPTEHLTTLEKTLNRIWNLNNITDYENLKTTFFESMNIILMNKV